MEVVTGLLRGLIGVGGFLLMAFLMSKNKKKINWKLVGCGLLLQIVIGALVLNPVVKTRVFDPVDRFVQSLLDFSKEGSNFVMMSVEKHEVSVYQQVERDGKTVEEPVKKTIEGTTSPGAKTFAFWVLPTVVFFSSIMTLLYFFGVMQPIVRIIARIMQKVMGTSGSETTSCSANIFMGQTEAPLVVKPFIATMTRSELHAVMVGGFATVAGGVMAMYAAILQSSIPGIAGHLVTASCMAAPGALYISKIIYPETEESDTMGDLKIEIEKVDSNAVEAAARGASEGMQLLINIVAMLIAFVALVAMADKFVNVISGLFLDKPITFTDILGWFFYPFAMLMGVPTTDCAAVGEMLGKKIVLTELLAYLDLSGRVAAGSLSMKAQIICSYALCGFANFASIGIQIGGISAIAPKRRKDLAELGFSAMCAGVLVTCITGTIAGIFMSFGY